MNCANGKTPHLNWLGNDLSFLGKREDTHNSVRYTNLNFTQILTSKVDPRTENKLCIMAVGNIGIQMKRKDLTKTSLMILNRKRPFGLLVYITIFQRFKG